MDKNILEKEQEELVVAQGLIDTEISKAKAELELRARTKAEKIDYYLEEKLHLDWVDKKDVMNDMYDLDYLTNMLAKNIKMLNRLRPKPFFAKISLMRDEKPESYYIGLKNIEKERQCYIIDWRTPLASLLYFSSLGKTSYIAPSGKIDVDLLLKRQFKLEPNKIISYFDTNTKIDDNILQDVLSQNTSSYMTNIVQTIQAEQNTIIRKPANQTVIINGVAGSGKTSIAMHRISYLLYVNRGDINSKNVLVISPNQLFSTYISELLPELGEENVEAVTLYSIFNKLNITPERYSTKLSMVEGQFANLKRKEEIDEKFSQSYVIELENFIKNFDVVPYVAEAFKHYNNPIHESILASVKLKPTNKIYEKSYTLIETVLTKKYYNAKRGVIRNTSKKLNNYVKKILPIGVIIQNFYKIKNLHIWEQNYGYEDVPTYSYINYLVNGAETEKVIRHIFVDEMQDYDSLSLTLLKNLYPYTVMTLAGDYNQNVLSAQNNLITITKLFPNVEVDKLDVSYRSTYEIIDFAQKIVGGTANKNLIRHGNRPQINKCPTDKDFVAYVNDIIAKHPNDKIAIITKTLNQAKLLSNQFNNFAFISDELDDTLISSNRILTTIYLSKGLEYDRVILALVDEDNYCTEHDKQNLYVASTRALHELYITYNKSLSKFVPIDNCEIIK